MEEVNRKRRGDRIGREAEEKEEWDHEAGLEKISMIWACGSTVKALKWIVRFFDKELCLFCVLFCFRGNIQQHLGSIHDSVFQYHTCQCSMDHAVPEMKPGHPSLMTYLSGSKISFIIHFLSFLRNLQNSAFASILSIQSSFGWFS